MNKPDETYKIVLLGDTGVGKTSLIKKYINEMESNDKTNSTISPMFLTKRLIINKKTIDLKVNSSPSILQIIWTLIVDMGYRRTRKV